MYSQTTNFHQLIASRPQLKTLEGDELQQARVNSRTILSVIIHITENDAEIVPFVGIIEVLDSAGITTYLQYQEGKISSSSSTNRVEISWVPEKVGNYTIRTFLLSDLSNPVPLSQVVRSSIRVGLVEVKSQRTIDDVLDDVGINDSIIYNSEKNSTVDRNSNNNSDNNDVQSNVTTDNSYPKLKEYALAKINEDREKYNLPPVKLSTNKAAQIQAEDVFRTKKISHWMTNGEKPYMSYTRYGGLGDVAQNVAVAGYMDDNYDGCISKRYLCQHLDSKKEIDIAENEMMYDDWKCCENGHRDNILDKYHTHVSIGIAYDQYFFVIVQNFENQYITWTDTINNNKNNGNNDNNGKSGANSNDFNTTNANLIKMAGFFDRNRDGYSNNDIKLEQIQIYYDPLPTSETYKQNYNKTRYEYGKLIGVVVEPPQPGWHYEQPKNFTLIEGSQWNVNTNDFRIEFTLRNLTKTYGDGVYTLKVWSKGGNDDESDDFSVSSKSLFFKN